MEINKEMKLKLIPFLLWAFGFYCFLIQLRMEVYFACPKCNAQYWQTMEIPFREFPKCVMCGNNHLICIESREM